MFNHHLCIVSGGRVQPSFAGFLVNGAVEGSPSMGRGERRKKLSYPVLPLDPIYRFHFSGAEQRGRNVDSYLLMVILRFFFWVL